MSLFDDKPKAFCKSCGSEIIYIKTENGAFMPLDAKPDKRIVIEARTTSLATVEDVAIVRDTYTSHFATCPDADKHRR